MGKKTVVTVETKNSTVKGLAVFFEINFVGYISVVLWCFLYFNPIFQTGGMGGNLPATTLKVNNFFNIEVKVYPQTC